MKRALLLFLVAVSSYAQNTQGNNQANIGGLLIASNFAQWTVPQGNQGGYTWSSPDFCKVSFAGATFNAFSVGTPVEIVDTGNPANNETVTVNNFASTSSQCSVYVSPTHAHNSFYFRSATAGLGEALAFAGQRAYQIILTPDWGKLGGITSTITSAPGNTNITISDQRTAQIVPYSWNGSAWVAGTFGGGSPGGATTNVQFNGSGSFGGDSSFTFNSTTKNVGTKIINGTSISQNYTGATLDVRLNACLTDAYSKINGNTSGICDASGDGGNQNVDSTVYIGTTSGGGVGLILPCTGYWEGQGSNPSTPMFRQYGGSSVWSSCPASAASGQLLVYPSSSGVFLYIWDIEPGSNNPYFYTEGFNVTNISGGHETTGNVGFFLNYGAADTSHIHHVNVYDGLDTIAAAEVAGCCQTTWDNSSINGDNLTTPLLVVNSTGGNFTEGFTFSHGTIVHPGPSDPVISLYDTGLDSISTADFDDVYVETNTGGSGTNCLFSVTGWAKASFTKFRIGNFGAGNNQAVCTSGEFNSDVTVDDMFFSYGSGSWNYPVLAVQNGYTGQNIYSDSLGHFNHYSIPSSTATVPALTSLGDLPYALAGGQAGRLSGNSAATDQVLVSHGTGLISTPTTKTCYVSGTGTSATCTWSSSPVAGEFVAVGIYNYSGTTSSVVDSAGDTLSPVASAHTATYIPGQLQLFYFGPLTSTITSITVNSTTSSGLTIVGDTATNIAATYPVDGSPCYADTFSSTSSSCAAALTTTGANDFVFCGAQNETGSDDFTAGAGFTAGANAGGGNSVSQYKVQSSIGNLTPAITSSSGSPMAMGCAAFKSALSTNAPTLTNAPALSAANMTGIPAPSPPLIVAGIVDGTAPVTVTTGTSATLGGTYSSGYTINEEGTAATAVTYTLPTAAAGKQYCVGNGYNGSAANTGTLELLTSASGQFIIFTDGTLSATGGYVISGGAARDSACVVGVDSTHWALYVNSGTWTKH